MEVYQKQYKLRNADVDLYRRLRPSVLLTMLQECAIAHTEELGMGRDKTLDRGLLWIIALQRISIRRMPVYDERITVRTWPGKTMHVFFPRYYEVVAEDGQVLIRGSALWTLINAETRTFIFPQQEGIDVPGVVTGNEISLPSGLRSIPAMQKRTFTVPYSHTDINGHMNNIRYIDECENMIPDVAAGQNLREIAVEYAKEIRLGESMDISLGIRDSDYFFSGDGEAHYFSLLLRYQK